MSITVSKVVDHLAGHPASSAGKLASIVTTIRDHGIRFSVTTVEKDILEEVMAATDEHPLYFAPLGEGTWWAVRADVRLTVSEV